MPLVSFSSDSCATVQDGASEGAAVEDGEEGTRFFLLKFTPLDCLSKRRTSLFKAVVKEKEVLTLVLVLNNVVTKTLYEFLS